MRGGGALKKKKRKPTTCKNCGTEGHTRKTCPNAPAESAEPAAPRINLTPAKLATIKKMLGEGAGVGSVAVEAGVSEETVERVAESLGI